MDDKFFRREGICCNFSSLLELAAFDDLAGFRTAVEEEGRNVDETGLWYGRRIGTKRMEFDERTPLMIAAMYGSMDVLSYIVWKGRVDVNRACGLDGVTALHCAIAGMSASTVDVVKCLLDASADKNCVDCNGRKPIELIASPSISLYDSMMKKLQVLLESGDQIDAACNMAKQNIEIENLERQLSLIGLAKEEAEKKEYPIDPSLPDIKNGIYGTDEFRMYIFKITPCSRAYSHDWTECPFVHPGENARRRDPKAYNYSCVPCPEFRKGSCSKGDNCEYSHGIFECWLHPAQYRTRLCKDGTSCERKVCFFAHRHEELRPIYASTGSAIPSPQSTGATPLEMGSMSPLGLASPSIMTPPTSTPPLTPGTSSMMGGTMWQNHCNLVPPTLQLPIGRFKRDLSARNTDLDVKSIGTESNFRQQNHLTNEMSNLTSQMSWKTSSALATSPGDRNAELNRLANSKNYNLPFRPFNPEISPRLQSPSLNGTPPNLPSPSGNHIKQNMNQQLLSNYSNMLSTSPAMTSQASNTMDSFRTGITSFDSPLSMYIKRSLSFTERSAMNPPSGLPSPASSAIAIPSSLSDWSSPNGKLDWSIQPEEINKARKYSFSFQRSDSIFVEPPTSSDSGSFDEPDVSWVQSLVKDAQSENERQANPEQDQQQYNANHMNPGSLPGWLEQLQIQQENNLA